MAIRLRLFALERKAWGITIALKLVKVLKLDILKILRKGKTSAAYWANKVFWAGKVVAKNDHPRSQKQTFGLKRKRTYNGNK